MQACLVLLLLLGVALPAAAQERRVVLLYDERPDLPGLALLDTRLAGTLRAGLPVGVEVYREAMDLSRFTADGYPDLFSDYLRAKYSGKRIDVVIAVLGPALDFALAHGAEAFPGAAIVFCAIDRRELDARRLPANVTGVILKREFAPTLDLALRLHPGTRRVVHIAGSSDFDLRLVEAARDEYAAAHPEVEVDFLLGVPLPDLLDTLAHLRPRTVVLYSTMFTDSAGRPYVPHEVAARIASAAAAPVYGFVDQYLGRGIVGGHLYSLDAHAGEAARLALRVLGGASPSSIPPVERPVGTDMFDWRQLGRWGIDERRLPAGSVVRYRHVSPWERYRTTILTILGALLLQSALIVALLVERRVRRRAQAALRESEARAAEQRREMAHLGRVAVLGELSAALAHEINQPLAAILVNARAAQLLLEGGATRSAELRAILADIAADDIRAGEVIRRVRGLVSKGESEPQLLSPSEVVGEALELARSDLQHRGVHIRTRFSSPAARIFGDRVQLQQVLLNLIINACDAMADVLPGERLLVVSTSSHDGAARIEVSDRGSGIAPETLESVFEPFVTTKRHGLGLGLAICRSIVTAHGGSMLALNNPEGGATLVVSLPLAPGALAAPAGPDGDPLVQWATP
jgi:signal transduction histidine kinase